MKFKAKKKLVLKVDEGYADLVAYSTPSMKKAEEDRNKVIPNYVMEAIKTAFPQKKLSNFFEPPSMRPVGQEQGLESHVSSPPSPSVQESLADFSPKGNVEEVIFVPSVEKLIGAAAVNIARELNANLIVTLEKGSSEVQDFSFDDVKVVIFRQVKTTYSRCVSYNTKMKRQQMGSVLPVKELLMEAVNRKYIGKGDKIIFVGGETVGSWLKGFFFVLDVDKVFFNISTHHLTEKISADVVEAAINIAQEIGSEGREGRSIGTAFILGDREDLLKYTKPLLKINPFGSLPDDSRKITDPEMKETIKNLAQLDGVFLVDEHGVILNAGAYINIDQNSMELPGLQGFGTRHRCTAAITKLTDSIGIVVSESGGAIRIFKEGRQVMKLP